MPNLRDADLLFVIGTSLTVHPFASLANMPGELCPRVLINMEQVGNIGRRRDDVVLLGECDRVVRDVCRERGWEDELIELWKAVQGEEEAADVRVAERVALEKAEAGRMHAEEEARRKEFLSRRARHAAICSCYAGQGVRNMNYADLNWLWDPC